MFVSLIGLIYGVSYGYFIDGFDVKSEMGIILAILVSPTKWRKIHPLINIKY